MKTESGDRREWKEKGIYTKVCPDCIVNIKKHKKVLS